MNEQLVAHGYAEWLLPEPVTEDGAAAVVAGAAVYLQPANGALPQPLTA